MEGWNRQGLMVSRIVFWCSFSNATISVKVNAANKEPMGHGVGIGVEGGHVGGCELLKTENRVKVGTEYLTYVYLQKYKTNKQNTKKKKKKNLCNLTCAVFRS